MRDRALQGVIKNAIEPEWEAVFEPNSYGFRPGRACQDAIHQIRLSIQSKPKYVLDADISKCFDKIDHTALLNKLGYKNKVRQQIKAWLTSGVIDNNTFLKTEEGTPQGGVISPLLANIALHGLENHLNEFAKTIDMKRTDGRRQEGWQVKVQSLNFVRYADDFVLMHKDKKVILEGKEVIEKWLSKIGLELKPSKTRIAHTLLSEESEDGVAGFNFLGYHVRTFKVGYHSSVRLKTGKRPGIRTLIKSGLRRCLKSGVNPNFPDQGTPQGGVVSPLLANIALNGIENIGKFRHGGQDCYKCIRYADDMVFILKPNDKAEEILIEVEEFLAARGMNVSQKKTKVTASTDGFDFLGWHFYVQKGNGKFKSTPSEKNFSAFGTKVKHIVNNSNYGAETKVSKLAPVVRGWRNYHKYCKMDGSRFSLWNLDHNAFKRFLKQETINRYQAKKMVKDAFPYVKYSENKFVPVKEDKSPFDGDINYWAKRNSVLYDGATAKTLRKQSYSCGHCKLKFLNEEKVELHHIDGNHSNWDTKNLLAIHRSCHHYVHMSKNES